MIGTPYIYYLLFYLEPDYRKFFKVKADFDSRIDRTPEAVRDYALFSPPSVGARDDPL